MKVYAATKNQGKIREINQILIDAGIECESFPNLEDVEETGDTFEENAKIKADYLSSKLHDEFVIADDSGLSVESLGGAPGVYSARYAGIHGDDNANNKKLLDAMKGVKNRKCKYECVIALSKNGKTIKTFYGDIKGEVSESERGSGGFGYDPLFLLSSGKTMAEISIEEKNKISHRYTALNKLREYLINI